jgi:energy-coupling factor transporter ATP-binding protein EcfA2
MIIEIDNVLPVDASYAAERTRGLYNVDAGDGAEFHLRAELPVEDTDWQIGVVVGPSGSGKTSIARALHEHQWGEAHPIIGTEPLISELTKMAGNYAKATAALAAVGLGSVPSWLRPYHVLSNGEQFRAGMAWLLINTNADSKHAIYRPDFSVYLDEFTSVLDRQVAKVGANAFARQWRRQPGRRVILITPHYDILEWVEPDWWLDTAGGETLPGEERKVVRAQKGTFQEASHRARYRGDPVGSVAC